MYCTFSIFHLRKTRKIMKQQIIYCKKKEHYYTFSAILILSTVFPNRLESDVRTSLPLQSRCNFLRVNPEIKSKTKCSCFRSRENDSFVNDCKIPNLPIWFKCHLLLLAWVFCRRIGMCRLPNRKQHDRIVQFRLKR